MAKGLKLILLLLYSLFGSLESYRYYGSYYSYRYYSYRYYSYRYYRSYYSYRYYGYYYYYSGTLSSSEKGIVAGSVIGSLFGIFLFTACIMYFCYYRGRRTTGTVISPGPITTITGSTHPVPDFPPDHRIVYTPDGPVYKTEENVGISQPPPPYETAVPAENSGSPPQYVGPTNAPSTINVDSTSTVNLVNNEVRHM